MDIKSIIEINKLLIYKNTICISKSLGDGFDNHNLWSKLSMDKTNIFKMI